MRDNIKYKHATNESYFLGVGMDIRNYLKNNLLKNVDKPGRYIGGEWNSQIKDWSKSKCQIAFCFPDVYEVGMSHLGLQILYGLINETTPHLMERVFMPWPDMYKLMESVKLPLYSLESYKHLKEFPLVGFTLQYEMSYTNILAMLKLGGIPLRSKDRRYIDYPLIIGGGPCSVNPEPIADFFDLFLIGDGEESLPKIMDIASKYIKGGKLKNKEELLIELSSIEGIYVPSYFQPSYDSSGKYLGTLNMNDKNKKVKKALIKNLEKSYYPKNIVVPFVDAVHDRMMLEVLRGCTHGCRFCQAGMFYRPVREKSVRRLLNLSEGMVAATGYNDISLTSLSTADYTEVESLVKDLIDRYENKKISISLPSLRVDTFSVNLANLIQKVRKTGFTFAPEAGTQKMRDIINKGVTEEDLMTSLEGAFKAGWERVKLYFMIGLPGEEDEDIIGIIKLAKKVLNLGRSLLKGKSIKVTVSVSSFVPKPFTPFQWFGQNSKEELIRKQLLLKEKVREIGKGLTLNYNYSEVSILEGMLARGDRRLSVLLEEVHDLGCMFDSWDEFFSKEKWNEAIRKININKKFYSERFYEKEDSLYWDHIDLGVKKSYLWKEYKKSMHGLTTQDCRKGCTGCGVCIGDIKMDLKGAYHG